MVVTRLFRSPMHAVAGALLAGACGLAACGGGGGSEGIALEDLPGELQRRICSHGVACGQYPDMATCQAAETVGDGTLLSLIEGAARGTVSYDPAQAKACLDAYFDGQCIFLRELEACDRMFEGRLAAGGACLDSEECAGGGTCTPDSACAGAACCPGTCLARVPLGGACDLTLPCVDQAFCDNGVCAPRHAPGAACAGPDQCLLPNVCDSAGVCSPLPSEGESCVLMAFCARLDNVCGSTGVCTRLKPPGTACVDSRECVPYADCLGVCTAKPSPGETCEDALPDPCIGHLACTGNRCTPPPPPTACPPPPG